MTHDMRELRARQTAQHIQYLLRDYVPRATQRDVYETLVEAFIKANMALIEVRPEWDELTRLELSDAMLRVHPYVISHPDSVAS